MVKRRPQHRGAYRFPHGKKEPEVSLDHKEISCKISNLIKGIINDLEKHKQPLTIPENQDNDQQINPAELPPIFDTFNPTSKRNALYDLSKESLKFLLFQSFIEIVLQMEYNENHFEEMWDFCHDMCLEDVLEANKIRTFAKEYQANNAINYYTANSCFYRLINRTLRSEDFDGIVRFGCYISDLHKQIKELSIEQRKNEKNNMKSFYRGQRFTTDIIQQFNDNKGHLISLNGLISTSKHYMVARMFAGSDETITNYHSVIFEFNIDSDMADSIRPYASIKKCSVFLDEEEILFFMGFVWKIVDIRSIQERSWYIELHSSRDYDLQLVEYTEKSKAECTYLTMGNILRELGDENAASNFYRRMLSIVPSSNDIQSHVYYNMAVLAEDQGRLYDAEHFYKEAVKYMPPAAPETSEVKNDSKPLFAHSVAPSCIHLLKSMAELYARIGDKTHARKNFEAALQQKGSDIEHAAVLHSYGLFEYRCRNLQGAKKHLLEAVKLAKDDARYSEFNYNLAVIQEHVRREEEANNAQSNMENSCEALSLTTCFNMITEPTMVDLKE